MLLGVHARSPVGKEKRRYVPEGAFWFPRRTHMLVRNYKNVAAYQKDALALAAQGWQVASVTESHPRAGCARIFLLGIFALVFPPKPQLVVTYTNQSAGAPGQAPLLGAAMLPASLPLPPGSVVSEPAYEPYHYDGRILAGLVGAFVLSVVLVGVDNGMGAVGDIGTVLMLAVFGGVAWLDWRGFSSLNGVVKWQRMSGGRRFWMVCAYIFLFPIMLAIYLIQASREYFYAKKPEVSEAPAVAVGGATGTLEAEGSESGRDAL